LKIRVCQHRISSLRRQTGSLLARDILQEGLTSQGAETAGLSKKRRRQKQFQIDCPHWWHLQRAVRNVDRLAWPQGYANGGSFREIHPHFVTKADHFDSAARSRQVGDKKVSPCDRGSDRPGLDFAATGSFRSRKQDRAAFEDHLPPTRQKPEERVRAYACNCEVGKL
jgi:hypothetical protein